MEEAERLLQISLRLKAARYLAGHHGPKGATALPVDTLVKFPAVLDEGLSANRITEAEQMKQTLKRSELTAIIRALGLPAEWFDGLYPSDRGEAISESLGAVLLGLAEVGRAHRPGRGGADARSDEAHHPRADEEADVG